MLQGQRVGRAGPEGFSNIGQGARGGGAEGGLAVLHGGVEQVGQHRQELLFLLGRELRRQRAVVLGARLHGLRWAEDALQAIERRVALARAGRCVHLHRTGHEGGVVDHDARPGLWCGLGGWLERGERLLGFRKHRFYGLQRCGVNVDATRDRRS